MAGDLTSLNADITTGDNFHPIFHPVHMFSSMLGEALPVINNECDGKKKCTLNTTSISDNFYDIFDSFDTGL